MRRCWEPCRGSRKMPLQACQSLLHGVFSLLYFISRARWPHCMHIVPFKSCAEWLLAMALRHLPLGKLTTFFTFTYWNKWVPKYSKKSYVPILSPILSPNRDRMGTERDKLFVLNNLSVFSPHLIFYDYLPLVTQKCLCSNEQGGLLKILRELYFTKSWDC